jgi:hypothetical protein
MRPHGNQNVWTFSFRIYKIRFSAKKRKLYENIVVFYIIFAENIYFLRISDITYSYFELRF